MGYYAYLRAPIIQHNLRFEEDWRRANPGFIEAKLGPDNRLASDQYTSTGYIGNLFTPGPAILWSPFFLLAHAVVLIANLLGAHISADGFSLPYRVFVAFGTAFYGFCGLLLSYLFARKYVESSQALLATLSIWAASSLPVYMYFNPFWSHAHSAFMVALFLWYWDRTQSNRTLRQWILLGVISGLLVDVYFVNGVFLLIPLIESIHGFVKDLRSKDGATFVRRFSANLAFLVTFVIFLLPTLITRRIVFGGMLRFGSYAALPWDWRAPFWRSVLFSSDHGMLSWNPLLAFALLGLLVPFTKANQVRAYLAVAAAAFFYVISSYPYWDGMSSFGNRFFISLTPVFVFGLAHILERVGVLSPSRRLTYAAQGIALSFFALWNLGFIFQWGTHLIPARGQISWGTMTRNQFVAVPKLITRSLESYFIHRDELMERLEREDIQQRESEGRRRQ